MEFLENRIGSGGLLERLGVGIVVGDDLIDALHKLPDAIERAAPDGLIGDQRKEAFDLVQPGTLGDEAHLPAGPACQPYFDFGMTVGSVVVHDAIHVEIDWHGLIDLTQKWLRTHSCLPLSHKYGSLPSECINCSITSTSLPILRSKAKALSTCLRRPTSHIGKSYKVFFES